MNRYVADNTNNSLITSNLESSFREARSNTSAGWVKQSTEPYKPVVLNTRGKTGAVDYKKSLPMIQDPRTTFLSLQVPENRKLLNALYRYYDSTDPIIQNANRLHTEFPLANMTLTHCGDPAIQRHFEDMWNDRMEGPSLLLDIGIEYNRLGNVITFGAWNVADLMWDKIAILNPDYVEIESTWLAQQPLIKLMPDEVLKRIVQTQKPWTLFRQLHPDIVRYVRLNKDIPLDPANVWHIAYNKAPYGIWGDPPVKSLLKLLFYESKLTEAQVAIAYRHIVPITLVKVGDAATGWIPDQAELNDVQEILAARELDPNMAIIYHYGINIEYIGASGKTLPVDAEFNRIDELKLMGLGISKAFIGGENGPTYSNASVSLAVLKQRYLHMTSKFSHFIEQGLFTPVAEACGFYKQRKTISGSAGIRRYTYGDVSTEAEKLAREFKESTIRDMKDNAEFKDYLVARAMERIRKTAYDSREYVMPRADWNLMTLAGDLDWRRWLSEFNDKFIERKGIPLVSEATLYRLMQLDEKAERKSVVRELRENKVRTEELQKEGIEVGPKGGGSAGLGDMGGGIGGGGGGLGDMGGGLPDETENPQEPISEPGAPGASLPTGGEVGQVGSPELPKLPTGASTKPLRLKTAFDRDDVVSLIENEINSVIEEEMRA